MAGPLSFPLQPKLIWLAVVFFLTIGYMTSMPQDFKKKLNFWTFLIMVPFEILSRNPNTDGSHWLREDVTWIMDEVIRENLMI